MNDTKSLILSAPGILVAISTLAFFIGLVGSACTPMARAKVADAISQLAGQVCVEGDSVEICARKCADASKDAEGGGSAQ